MFSLAVLSDSVRVHPKSLQSSISSAVIDGLNGRYCNKVISDVGLGVSVFDVLEMNDPYVHPGESHAFIKGSLHAFSSLNHLCS
jgi:DNA-directed RNA polymerase III subunit RPC8